MIRRTCAILVVLLAAATLAPAAERFPAPEFRTGYQVPPSQVPQRTTAVGDYVDLAVLVGALALAPYLIYKRRSRRGVFILTLFSLAYFGFYKQGCICPIGSIQNVAMAAGGNGYQLPWTVAAIFLAPLLFAIFYGRVFCAAVCPLGAIQDVVLYKPVHVPAWVEHSLGLLAYLYLGLGVLYAAVGSDFLICRFDPFVGFFRLSGPAHMLVFGASLLLLSMFVGRSYCRFLCPYGILLRCCAPLAKRRVTITPDACVDCRLCETACPFGAIRSPIPRQTQRQYKAARRQLAIVIGLTPLVVGLFAFAGYLSRHALAQRDFTVRLAERIHAEETGKASGRTDESKAFRTLGQPVSQLFERVARIRHRYAIGGAALGVFLGVVVAGKLLAIALRRTRKDWTADPAACVACARCYASCPVEIEVAKAKKLKAREEELVAV